MNSVHNIAGRVRFVGSGPGDPGLLTKRALDAIAAADLVVYDTNVGHAMLEAAQQHAADSAVFTANDTTSSELVKDLIAAAREGRQVVRLIAGEPYPNTTVESEFSTIGDTEVFCEVIPAVSYASAVSGYAGMPPGTLRTLIEVDDPSRLEPAALAQAVARGTLVLTSDVTFLAGLRDALLTSGMEATTSVAVTGDVTGETQFTTLSTIDTFVEAALGFAGRVVLTLGAGVGERIRLGWWENRPLYGWKVLIPRTKEQAGEMSDLLRSYGAIPCEVPTIAVEPPRTPAQMERAIKGLVDGRYAWIVFTSANAVKAIWEKFAEHGLDARAFGGIKIACVGNATADKVRSFGIEPELLPDTQQSGEGLLDAFPPHDAVLDPVGRVLLPRADIATEALSAGLQERGWEVDDVTAYRTVRASPPPAEIRDAIKSGGFDAVLFTSSSTVRNLVGIAGKPHARTVVSVIGPHTAETATEFGLRVDAQPDHANVPSLVEALAGYAVDLRKRMSEAPVKQRRGAKVQGPTALRFRS
ncbi:MAG TPA: uroporphyrinogen-III synthase [Stackebrandtia sp.]|jgi:uroporphyrinogen III methyltransferase/synthase|uniref:uroporphyrinogen-III synthase n=1 Tax=Stackebrandtia sp. TaxID=2023065 RepID=UPI002D5B6F72|nr:uroporphyrinogen-III synthase [Stackebrandtia sp.]HZE37873.1 uroporphyrinogen-III synthase [Stackebrandtia sp.]